MTIKKAISGVVFTRLVTTSSLIAKLAACAILLAGVTCAQAANDDGVNASNASHHAAAHTMLR